MSWQHGLLFMCLFVAVICDTVVQGADVTSPCRVIDAALRYRGDLYLFSGKETLKLNKTGVEIEKGNVADWGLPSDIDAALQWSGYGNPYYFFKHPVYYRYDVGIGSRGPWNAAEWWGYFFMDGIDAAGNRNGLSYFFKGCRCRKYGNYYPSSISNAFNSTAINLPCDVDAAWDLNGDWDTMVLAKRNQIWLWSGNADGQGPYEFSSRYTIYSWRLCTPSETVG